MDDELKVLMEVLGSEHGLPCGSLKSQIRSRCLNGERVMIFC